MIRLATRSDIPALESLLEDFLLETAYAEHCEEMNPTHLKKLLFAIIHQGYVWVLCHNEVLVGCLIAVKEQNVWIPSKVSLRELVWYVKEEYRKTMSAGKLFVEFCKKGDELLERGDIQGYFTTRMTTTTDYDLESRGFRLTEKLYLKD
jgi:hypothetical protein